MSVQTSFGNKTRLSSVMAEYEACRIGHKDTQVIPRGITWGAGGYKTRGLSTEVFMDAAAQCSQFHGKFVNLGRLLSFLLLVNVLDVGDVAEVTDADETGDTLHVLIAAKKKTQKQFQILNAVRTKYWKVFA